MTARVSKARGFTLIEVMVAIAVLSMIATVIYSAFAGMRRTKEGVERINDRYREGRLAMSRMVRELQSAFISMHQPIPPVTPVQKTIFKGTQGSPGDRIDFASFAHRRLVEDARETDQQEVSYYAESDPEKSGVVNLVRRVSPRLDLYPEKGGKVEVLATDIDLFQMQYLDAATGQWNDRWDTSQATEQVGRLPLQVRIVLVLNGGSRHSADRGQGTIRLVTKVMIPMTKGLTFAVQGS